MNAASGQGRGGMDADPGGKPRMVYFQRKFQRGNLVRYVQHHYDQQLKCFSRFFDVTVVQEDADFGEVCDRHEPDLALFELGISAEGYRRLTITNLGAHPDVPRVGYYNADAFCRARSATLRDIDRWELEAIFSLSIVVADYLPASVTDRLFYLPNFIDPDLYHDYGNDKTIPVLFTGSQASYYPWRRRIQRVVAGAYPSLLSPHKGYQKQKEMRLVTGERYARMINASSFVATCGTVVNELVRKHLEIPGAKACLLTEATPAVAAAGFVDMENCVTVDETDVLDKLDLLFADPDRLATITQAGYDLVHSRHTLDQRNQISTWLTERARLMTREHLAQPDPFGPVVRVTEIAPERPVHLGELNAERRAIADGYAHLWAGDLDEAARRFEDALASIAEIKVPEPRLGLALCHLLRGEPDAALGWLASALDTTLIDNRVAEPDPVEWAYFLVALLCRGEPGPIGRCATAFPSLRHPELVRAGWALDVVAGTSAELPLDDGTPTREDRPSVHRLPPLDLADWADRTARMLDRSARSEAAVRLRSAASVPAPGPVAEGADRP